MIHFKNWIHDNWIIQILSIYLNESDEYYLKNSMDIEFIIEFQIISGGEKVRAICKTHWISNEIINLLYINKLYEVYNMLVNFKDSVYVWQLNYLA